MNNTSYVGWENTRMLKARIIDPIVIEFCVDEWGSNALEKGGWAIS